MLDSLTQTVWDAHPVIRWLMTDGRRILGSNEFLEGFAFCLRQAGIDVTRITTGVPILPSADFLVQRSMAAQQRRVGAPLSG